jgi:nucleotide-binding universal stress UspA family protein
MQSSFSTVLVPLDGSSYAERAIEPARKLAAMLNIRVGAVRCVGEADQGDNSDGSYLEAVDLESVTQDRHLAWYQAAQYTDVPAWIGATLDDKIEQA